MKIMCPKCGQVVPANQVNMATDLALCPGCNEGFKVSEAVDGDLVNASVLDNPPGGLSLTHFFSRHRTGS
jgi:anti-sigma factor ChrR (cupin superfamily)